MRAFLLVGWLMVPVAYGAFHYGPGQRLLALDDTSLLLREADRFAVAGRWDDAEETYASALESLPPDRPDVRRRVRLELAKARMFARKLPEAHQELTALAEELASDPSADARLTAEVRSALAQSQYYMTWLLRLEGEPREIWEPQIESSRQLYGLLAEQAQSKGDATATKRYREDTESAIRLARMDLSELQGLSLPSQCKGCKSGQCKGKRKGKKKGKGKSKSKPEGKEDARGASSGPPPDGTGN